MDNFYKRGIKLGALAFFLSKSNFALAAGGSITFTMPSSGSPTGIPTLSGTMLIILSLLLFIVAMKISKQKKPKINKLFLFMMGSGILLSASGGIKLVSDVNAGQPSTTIAFASESNSVTYTMDDGESFYFFANDFTTPLSFSIAANEGSVCDYDIYDQPSFDETIRVDGIENATGVMPVGDELFIRCYTPVVDDTL